MRWLEAMLTEPSHPALAVPEPGSDGSPTRSDVAELGASRASAGLDLRKLAYALGHDVRAPLRAVVGFSQLLASEEYPVEGAKRLAYQGRVLQGAENLQSMIDSLVTYCSVGDFVEQYPVDATGVVKRAVARLSAAETECCGRVEWENLPTVFTDSGSLQRVFEILIDNALKFSSAPSPVRVSSIRTGEQIVFSVDDRGIGIAETDLERVFDLFTHLHVASEYPGQGMGLAIASRILETQGGRLWVDSTPGVGSRFRFSVSAIR